MNKTTKILLVLVVLIFAASPSIAEKTHTKEQLFQLGNADRTYDYQGSTITCYLGQLFPGQPIYWCLYPDGSMDHSWFVYQSKQMNEYYVTGGDTATYTYSGRTK